MNNGTRRALTGSIHKVREFELEKVSLVEEFDILQIVGEGWFGKILLVEHRASDTEIVLKALPKPYVSIRDFYREFHYSLHLSAHRNIVTTFDVAFETAGFYVFCQEYAPLGDLTSNMLDTGIGEIHTKRVAKQLSSALEHLHQRDLVHRDVKLDNILIFKSDFSRIKLCDFGETRKVQSAVRRRNEWLPYSPPEVLKLAMDSSYKALINHDVWQFGIVIFICLTGCLPWQKAAFDDPRYTSYYGWYNSSNPLKKQPKLWKMVSSRAQKMFKKFVEPREDKRATNFVELSRYLDDRWMAKGYTDRVAGGDIDELCPSMYSFHSDPNEKNILLRHFRDNGIETTVDRQVKKQRIREWIQNSVIEEADEEEESAYERSAYDDSDTELEDRSRPHPIDESHRVTLRYDTEKHINPRTGEVVDGVKHQPTNKNPLSYDVQNIEPVAPDNVVRRYGIKEEGSSHSSTKDSAYGSMEVKVSSSKTSLKENRVTSLVTSSQNSPSRSLSGSSIQQSRSPLTSHAQRIQRSEEVYSKELESMKGSTSTLHSLGASSRSNSLHVHRNGSLEIHPNINTEVPLAVENTAATTRPNNPVVTQNGFSPGSKQPQSHQFGSNQPQSHLPGSNLPQSHQSRSYQQQSHLTGSNQQQSHQSEKNPPKSVLPGSNLPQSQKFGSNQPQSHLPGDDQPQPQLPGSNQQQSHQSENNQPKSHPPGSNLPQPQKSGSNQLQSHLSEDNQQKSHQLRSNQPQSHLPSNNHPQSNQHVSSPPKLPLSDSPQPESHQFGRKQPQTHQVQQPTPLYTSMKSTVYDRVNTKKDPPNFVENNQSTDSPYTSMMNIVQGQIKITPHANEVNRNMVDVSIIPVANNRKN